MKSSRTVKATWTVCDWCATGVTLARVESGAGQATMVSSTFLEWPAGLDPMLQAEDCGAWLRLQCEQLGYSTKTVALLLPRHLIQVRLLRFPGVSDSELEKLVTLQTETRASSSAEQLAWDLLIHPDKGEGERFVTMLTISETHLQGILSAAKAASWSLQVVTCGDLCLNHLSSANEAVDTTQFIVLANRSKLEVLASRNRQPIASATLAIDEEDSNRSDRLAHHALSMIRRLNAGLPQTWQASTIAHCSVAGLASDSLADSLVSCQATVLNRDERQPRILAVVEAACRQGLLLNPAFPQRERQRQIRRRSLLRTGICAVGLLGVVGLYVQSAMADSAAELVRLQTDRDQLAEYAKRGKTVVRTVADVSQWKSETRDCSLELAAILSVIESPNDIVLTRIQMEQQAEGMMPVVRLDGLVRSPDVLLKLHQALMQCDQVQALRPQGVEPAPEDAVLPTQFRLELVLAATNSVSDKEQPSP